MNKTMTNIEMVEAVNGLNAFIKKDKTVPVKLSCAISGNVKTLIRELEPYEEQRQKMIASDEIPKDDFVELCNIEVDVNVRTVPAEVIENLEISTKDYMALEFMIE